MKYLLLAFFTMGLGYTASGCVLGCTDLGCDYGVHITVPGVATKFSSLVPFVIKACSDDGSCVPVTIRQTGGEFVCEEEGTQVFVNCQITPAGDVSFDLAFMTKPKDDVVAITVNVRDSMDTTVFTSTANAELADIEANGPGCGVTCQQGQVIFVP
jgi:hypothetical protein